MNPENLEDHSLQGAAFFCTRNGEILEVLRNDFRFLIAGYQTSLKYFVDQDSYTKFTSFLKDVTGSESTLNWEINCSHQQQIKTFIFSGLVLEDQLLIVITENKSQTDQLLEEILKINNQQTNLLREAIKEQQELLETRADDQQVFDEISKLNNELVSLQRTVEKQRTELERLNAQKDYFLGMAAHDLRNPLGVIMSFSEFLEADLENMLTPDQAEFLKMIHSSSRYMLALVDDLLDVTTISRGKLTLERKRVEISNLLERLFFQNQVLAQHKNIEIVFQSEIDPEARVYLDPTRFSQVINNLVSNAVKFSPEGSQIIMDCVVDQDHLRVRVKDQGPGIPADELKGIFDMYQRTSVTSTAGEKSTGLGLAIASKIVQEHEGDLDVQSEIGVGTIFTVSIPRCLEQGLS